MLETRAVGRDHPAEYLCEKNAVDFNPVKGAKRPKVDSHESKTPAIGDHQAPDPTTLKGLRDRTALRAALSRTAPRRALSANGSGRSRASRRPAPARARQGRQAPEAAGHGGQPAAPLFQPARRTTGGSDYAGWGIQGRAGIRCGREDCSRRSGVHGLRATAATNALDHEADLAKVQAWLGHTNIATTRLYDRRRHPPEDSPTFKVAY